MIVDRNQLSDFLGISKSRIMQLVRQGVLTRVSRGQYDAGRCVQDFIAFKLAGPNGSSDVNEARRRLYDAQVVKTELETSRIKREMIPADEFMIDMNQLAVMFSSGLDALGGRLAAQLAGMNDPAEIAAHLTLETNSIRESVADAITMYASTVSYG